MTYQNNEIKSEKARQYEAYLLRLWQVERDGRWVWQASVEDSHTGERHGFADIAELCAFINEKTGDKLDKPAPES